DLLIAAERDSAEWRVLHARDHDDCSVRELVTEMARSFGRNPRLIVVPRVVMRAAAMVTGSDEVYQRLFEPLLIDDDETRQALNWAPPLSRICAVDEVVRWWRTKP
ncbi:MAG: hypothetical protein NT024_10860, partial [Proteobacteria bacterium]|nr:hypothetical protein [Pseudomonadota bacterium]